jgi:two-component system chemotaxis response regulator CheB
MGASMGGFEAISIILQGLPASFPAAIAIVQHRRPDSDSRLEHLLAQKSNLPVHITDDKDVIEPGHVYISPPDYHLLIDEDVFSLSIDEPVSWSRPSIDVLFETAAVSTHRPIIGVLLTAASSDGAAGIRALAKRGGVTIVQDPKEAMSPVAPLAALAGGPVDHILKVAEIAPLLCRLTSSSNG